MSAHCARLSRLFTVEYAKRINAQIVHPAQTVIVKPNELESALCRPLHMSVYEPHQSPAYLAATLSYEDIPTATHSGVILSWMVISVQVRLHASSLSLVDFTFCLAAFFLANQYLRAMGIPGLADGGEMGSVADIAQRYMDVAAGKLELDGLADLSR